MKQGSAKTELLAARVMVSCDWCGQTLVIAPGAARRCGHCERRELFLCGEAREESREDVERSTFER